MRVVPHRLGLCDTLNMNSFHFISMNEPYVLRDEDSFVRIFSRPFHGLALVCLRSPSTEVLGYYHSSANAD